MTTGHPDYPAQVSPGGDRCQCGGIQHWHSARGCDDCDCREFVPANPTAEQVARLNAYLYGGQGELDDLRDASGLILEVTTWTYKQLIGPFPTDGADIFTAIETLKAEESRDEVPNTYAVRLLFPIHYAAKRESA